MLFVEPLELHDVEAHLCEPLGVVLRPLSDGVGEPKGSGADGGIEHGVEGKYGLS